MQTSLARLTFVAGILALALLAGWPEQGSAAGKLVARLLPPGWPKVVMIPRLGLTAAVEPVAMTNVEDVHAPRGINDVAWYSRGHRPGERGRAQIFGHLDSTCCPAIFYRLRDLKRGDPVLVRYRVGPPLTFIVRWSATYPTTHMPIAFMYGPTTDHGLMLITCAGLFHRDGTGYDHRLMVYATLAG